VPFLHVLVFTSFFEDKELFVTPSFVKQIYNFMHVKWFSSSNRFEFLTFLRDTSDVKKAYNERHYSNYGSAIRVPFQSVSGFTLETAVLSTPLAPLVQFVREMGDLHGLRPRDDSTAARSVKF
jgi:hypothetical protein